MTSFTGWTFLDFIKDEHERGCNEHGVISVTQAINGAIDRILDGYRGSAEAEQAAEDFEDIVGFDIYGFPKSPESVNDAVAEKKYLQRKENKKNAKR